jgi:cyclopropane fatty-acyl-phospholipid synthase-like methyltransferase
MRDDTIRGEVVLDKLFKSMPAVRNALSRIKRVVKSARQPESQFETSARYWEDRYRSGGNSGAGSYSNLAAFKADVLNEFVAANAVETVIEFGSGDGAQLELAKYPRYVGVDISQTALALTRRRFAADVSKRWVHSSEVTDEDRADAALSLDVIYHLIEDDVFDSYMTSLFNSAIRYVIVYASNIESPAPSPHVRHREFTRWIEANRSDFRLLEKIANLYPFSDKDPNHTSFADFYIFERVKG